MEIVSYRNIRFLLDKVYELIADKYKQGAFDEFKKYNLSESNEIMLDFINSNFGNYAVQLKIYDEVLFKEFSKISKKAGGSLKISSFILKSFNSPQQQFNQLQYFASIMDIGIEVAGTLFDLENPQNLIEHISEDENNEIYYLPTMSIRWDTRISQQLKLEAMELLRNETLHSNLPERSEKSLTTKQQVIAIKYLLKYLRVKVSDISPNILASFIAVLRNGKDKKNAYDYSRNTELFIDEINHTRFIADLYRKVGASEIALFIENDIDPINNGNL